MVRPDRIFHDWLPHCPLLRPTLPRVTSPLHEQPLLPHLIIQSLAAHDDAPCIFWPDVSRRTQMFGRGPAS